MNIFFSILIILISSFFLIILWSKTEVNKKFVKYQKSLINIKNNFNNLEIDDLDKLAFTGLVFLVSIFITLLPFFFTYLAILKLFSSQLISLILSGIVLIPVIYKIKK